MRGQSSDKYKNKISDFSKKKGKFVPGGGTPNKQMRMAFVALGPCPH